MGRCVFIFFFQAEDGIRDLTVTGVQTCALPIFLPGGVGLAHADGRTVMAPLTAPGDRLRIRVDRTKGNVDFASIEEIIEPSPLRRSEEHTSELQSQSNLVCRLLLEKKTRRPPRLPRSFRCATRTSESSQLIPPEDQTTCRRRRSSLQDAHPRVGAFPQQLTSLGHTR